MAVFITLGSFVFLTGLVALGTWLLTRHDRHDTSAGYFLGGRSLTAGYIAGSLLLTNLSTEQLVGLNGDAFADGLSVMAWEVIAGFSLVLMALYFLPRYLRSGIATVPQFLEERFDGTTRSITTLIFVVAYTVILLPLVLFTGATGLAEILDLPTLTGISDRTALLWLTVWLIGIIGSIYAIFGGLRSVAVSDTLNGFGLLVGGLLITYLALKQVNPDGAFAALETLKTEHPEKFNSLGSPDQGVPWTTLFTGVLLLNLFYWCTNQQIIQRAFAAPSLAEGQKGVLLAGFFKVFAPLILVLPGIVAFHLYGTQLIDGKRVAVTDVTSGPFTVIGETTGDDGKPQTVILHGADAAKVTDAKSLEAAEAAIGKTATLGEGDAEYEVRVDRVLGPGQAIMTRADGELQTESIGGKELISPRTRKFAYGTLVRNVLPPWLAGSFAAVMFGAILSSFNSALNSTATLFSLGVYQSLKPNATEKQVIASGKWFGLGIAVLSMLIAPALDGQDSIFGYLQTMNAIYFIPIFSVVLVGMLSRLVPAFAANIALIGGVAAMLGLYFVPQLKDLVANIHNFHLLGIVFVSLIALMLVLGLVKPRPTAWVQRDSREVDMTPWKFALPAGIGLTLVVLAIYLSFADLSAAQKPANTPTAAQVESEASAIPGKGENDDKTEKDLDPATISEP